MNPIPEAWLKGLKPLQKRIVLHWTVTGYQPDAHSLDSYHFIINGKGEVIRGSRDIDEPCPHTYMLNSAIGISLACMGGWNGSTKYPPTKEQWETLVAAVRQLCKTYDIPCARNNVLMHGEVTEMFGPEFDQWGKWDIGYLPHAGIKPETGEACGNLLRKQVKAGGLVLVLGGVGKPVPTPAPNVVISYRLQGSPTVLEGFLFDGSGYIPLRAFTEWATKAGYKLLLGVEGKNYYVSDPTGAKDVLEGEYRNIKGTGFAPLKNLATYLDLKIEVETWTKEKKILVLRKK